MTLAKKGTFSDVLGISTSADVDEGLCPLNPCELLKKLDQNFILATARTDFVFLTVFLNLFDSFLKFGFNQFGVGRPVGREIVLLLRHQIAKNKPRIADGFVVE